MKKILFLTDFYYPKPLPNGICIHQVAVELIKIGYDIHLIAYNQEKFSSINEYEGVKIHYIPMRLFYKLRIFGEDNIENFYGKVVYRIAKTINKIAKLIYLPWFPMTSFLTISNYYKKAKNLNDKLHFDAIIAVFDPESTLFAGILLKKKFPKINYGAYILDSLIFLSGKSKLPVFLQEKLSWNFEQKIYKNADMIFNMETHRVHHLAKKYDPFRHKMNFLDIPLFTPRQPIFTHPLYDSNKKHLVYMGTLFKGYRDPNYMYELFKQININDEYQLHFYTRGNCEDDVLRYQRETKGTIVRHGFVAHSEIDNIFANSHFLINLGVSNSTAISSKIFDYMSTGKPIINFYYHDDDVCLPYFDKYKLSLMIKMDESMLIQNAEKLKEFLIQTYNKYIDSGFLVEAFEANTPKYTADIFDKLANGKFKLN